MSTYSSCRILNQVIVYYIHIYIREGDEVLEQVFIGFYVERMNVSGHRFSPASVSPIRGTEHRKWNKLQVKRGSLFDRRNVESVPTTGQTACSSFARLVVVYFE